MDSLDAIFLKGLNRDYRTPFYPGFTGTDCGQISGFTYDNGSFFKNAGSETEEVNTLSQFSVLSGKDDHPGLHDVVLNQSAINLSVTTASNLLLTKNEGIQFTEAETDQSRTKDGVLIHTGSINRNEDDISFDNPLFTHASPSATDDGSDLFSDFSRDVFSNAATIPHPDQSDYYFIPTQQEDRHFGIGLKKNRGF